MAYWQPRVEEGVKGRIWCEMGEGWRGIYKARKVTDVRSKGRTSGAIAQQSKGCIVRLGITRRVFWKVASVQYSWRTSTILFIEYNRTFYQCTFGGGPPYVHIIENVIHPVFQCTSTLKDRGVRPPTLAYVRSRSPIPQNAFLADPSDPKPKLTF